MLTYDQAKATFDFEYARSNGFGRASVPVDGWTADVVKKFISECDQAAAARGAQLKGVLVGPSVARGLGIDETIGQGSNFGEIPCFVTFEDDRIDLIFGPSR